MRWRLVWVLLLSGAGCAYVTPAELEARFDEDADGHEGTQWGGDDCDDTDPAAYPGAPELTDGVDNDCDGVVDEVPDVAVSDRGREPVGNV